MINRIKQFVENVRQDSSALFQLRQLLFGVVIAVVVIYGFKALYLEPKEQEKKKNIEKIEQLTDTIGGSGVETLLGGKMRQLVTSRTELEKKLSQLKFKERVLREQYSAGGETEAFTKAVFTLLPQSPVDIKNAFLQMKVLDPYSYDFFDVNPISLRGKMDFSELIHYLKYLEDRPEIGMIGDIHLELPHEKSFGANGKIEFDLILGSIILNN